MTSREIVRRIVGLEPAPRCGFWLGNPHPESWAGLHRYFGTKTEEELRRKVGDDYRWISPSLVASTFPSPESKGIFGWAAGKTSHGQAGPLAAVEDPAELDGFDWPDPSGLDFSETLSALDAAGPYYRASGFWAPFYHDLMDLFGMEAYFVKMRTHPEVVEAATDRVCGFYHAANERYFDAAGDRVDAYFFGNDFGTQLDLMIGPALFDRFILPWFQRLTGQARRRGYQVVLHSCGSIHRVIPKLIAAGVDCLHPLQAKAAQYGRRDAGPGFRRQDRLPGRDRHAAHPASRLARRRSRPRSGASNPCSVPTSSSAPATKRSCPMSRRRTSRPWPRPRPSEGPFPGGGSYEPPRQPHAS